ncbi:MAG: hypothetical protein JNK85_04800 [Verrucomicrobiales bacterium]|nr:hypothetical protein [Verrucomicrobiales bacterium]
MNRLLPLMVLCLAWTAWSLRAATAPSLEIHREGPRNRLVFTGILESATTLQGPWAPVVGATSPWWTESDAHGDQYFRSRTEGLFDVRSVVDWFVQGPLQTHFELAFAGLPDGIFPPKREKPYFDGQVTMGEYDRPASLRVRGNSSLQECPFPKLKLKLSRQDRVGTPFATAREIKIGSHCAEGGQGPVGRLRDETATYREALAYEIMEVLGFLSPRVRRARIEYRDTSPAREGSTTGWQVRRQALLVEDIEVVGERLGGRALSDEEITALRDAGFEDQLLIDLRCFHALLGNWDYSVAQSGDNLWNTDVVELPGGKRVPVAGDFDLASWVTGEVRLMAPHDYRPDLEDLTRQAYFEVNEIRRQTDEAAFAMSQARFEERRSAMESWIATATLDEPGRSNAVRHVSVFFEALAEAAKGGKRE